MGHAHQFRLGECCNFTLNVAISARPCGLRRRCRPPAAAAAPTLCAVPAGLPLRAAGQWVSAQLELSSHTMSDVLYCHACGCYHPSFIRLAPHATAFGSSHQCRRECTAHGMSEELSRKSSLCPFALSARVLSCNLAPTESEVHPEIPFDPFEGNCSHGRLLQPAATQSKRATGYQP